MSTLSFPWLLLLSLFLVVTIRAANDTTTTKGAAVPPQEQPEHHQLPPTTTTTSKTTKAAAVALSSTVIISSSTRSLRDGNPIPSIGLGLSLTANVTYRAVQWALDAGYRLMDTAAEEDTYGNEEEVGRAIRDYIINIDSNSNNNDKNSAIISRDDIFVTTKLWDDAHGFWEALEAFDESYQSLNVGTVDLYLIHSPFGGRLVETWDAMLYLQSKGYVTSIGVSNFGLRHLQAIESSGRPMPVVNQIEMHPLVYRQRASLLSYCQQHDIKIQAYGSLMHGYEEWLSEPEILVQMAAKYQKKTSQIMLRWALQHDFLIIPKSANRTRIVENSLLYDFELSQEDMATLDSWGDSIPNEEHRNLYKEDWNWNPIDEAPVHVGRMDYWPKYEGVDEIYYADDNEDIGRGEEF